MSENGSKCCATISRNILFFTVLVVEAVFIVSSTVFTFLNVFGSDEGIYKKHHPELSEIVGFHFLLPIFVYQIIWLFSNIASIFLVYTNIPYIFFITILVPFFGLIASIVILVPSVNYIITHNFNVNSIFITFAGGLAVFVCLMILFIIVRLTTLRKMMKRTKIVQGSTEKPDDPEGRVPAGKMKDPDEISTTFSRRSTMSMTEERYVPPPRF